MEELARAGHETATISKSSQKRKNPCPGISGWLPSTLTFIYQGVLDTLAHQQQPVYNLFPCPFVESFHEDWGSIHLLFKALRCMTDVVAHRTQFTVSAQPTGMF